MNSHLKHIKHIEMIVDYICVRKFQGWEQRDFRENKKGTYLLRTCFDELYILVHTTTDLFMLERCRRDDCIRVSVWVN